MKPKARFDARSQTVIINDGINETAITLDTAGAIFEALAKASMAPALEEPEGTHYPTGINAVPAQGSLALYMEFPNGSSGQFVFPAPGKSLEQVAAASEAIKAGFAKLFAVN